MDWFPYDRDLSHENLVKVFACAESKQVWQEVLN